MARWMALGLGLQPVLAACAQPRLLGNMPLRNSARRLSRVLVSPDRVIRTLVGLRPFRRSGFLVKAEAFGDKTLIHNYGHGGGGVSLSWGTAQLALERSIETPHRRAAVLGCGAVGLATARLLQDHGFVVAIYARDLPPSTTSNIAGAQWSPVTVADDDRRTPAFDSQFVTASRFAFRYFQSLVGPRYGVSWRENYRLSETVTRPTQGLMALLDDLLHYVDVPVGEHQFGELHMSRFLSMHIEPSIYLNELLTAFRLAGGTVVVREFANVGQLAGLPEPLLVNCTGLGAGLLFGDDEMLPIKGQLTVLAPQPEVDYITIGPGDLYMMPRRDGIILGGTHERGVWSLEPNPAETDRILAGQAALFARMS